VRRPDMRGQTSAKLVAGLRDRRPRGAPAPRPGDRVSCGVDRSLAWLAVIAGCGRIGFGAAANGDALDDTIPIDGITATAACDVPTRIGTAIPTGGLLAAAMDSTSYRIAWIAGDLAAHLLAVERSGDTITTRERTFPSDAFQPMPFGADVTITQGVTVLTYWAPG